MLVFVGSRTTRERHARGDGLSVFEVDGTFTQWRLLQVVDLVNPSFLHVDAASRRLYAVHGDLGDVSALAVAGDGRLTLLNRQPVLGRNPVHLELSCDGRHLLVASYASGSLSALPLHADGSLGAASSRLALHGEPGPYRTEQHGPHPHHLPRWPGTDLFVVPDKGLDRVHVVRLSPDGVLGLVCQSVARSGSGPRHAAFDVAERRVWVANELDSTVTAYGFDVGTGTLHAQRTVGLLPDDFTGESRAAGIAVAHETVYVSNRGHDSVTVLKVDRKSGAVVDRCWLPTLGRTPRFLALTPDGAFVIVANEGSDTLVRWRLGNDGALADGCIVARTGSPVCVAFMS